MSSYRIPENLAVSDSGFLFMPATGETFTLNETGREIFRMLQQGLQEEEIVKGLCTVYDCDKLSAERDMSDFLSQLQFLGLLWQK